MPNPICWFEIYVTDINRAQKFYETILDIKMAPLGDPSDKTIEMRSFPSDHERYGASGALVQMECVTAGQNSVLVYFSCEDCALEASRIEAAGGQINRPKFSIGEFGFITIATDTEGNAFGLHSLK